jgi:hypothetical protein
MITAWVLSLAALAAPAAEEGLPVTFSALLVNMTNVGRTGATPVEISIERWSSDEERDRLHNALIEKGSDALLKAMQKTKPRAGFIRATGSLGWNIQFAQREQLPSGGERVVFATDRPMTFREVANNARSAEYQFLLGELRIGADGKGEGKLVPRAKITWNDGARTIEVENYANEPVRLNAVTESKSKKKE